jgi:hypothetical protein
MEGAMENPLTAYVTAQAVVGDLREAEGRERAAGLLRRARVGRVVLESYRGGTVVDEEELAALRDWFQDQGIASMGGIMPVHGGDFGKLGEGVEARQPWFCYSDETTVSALEGEIRKLSRLFDAVVIDDAFLTVCRCPHCDAARGGSDWGLFRRTLLGRVSERLMTAAHGEKANVQLIVKFPQYYDRYHLFGYDADRFPEIFDGVWQGTETRDPETHAFGYVEPYEAYFNMLWMRACAGTLLQSAWFDYLDCDEQNFYEQAVTTHLSRPGDLTLFCYGQELFGSSMIERVADSLPALERLSAVADAPEGVHVVKPANSDGGRDLFIFDYFGMMGIPCIPAKNITTAMRCVILPAHAAGSPEVLAAIPGLLTAGRTVIATFGALARMAGDPDLLALFGYNPQSIAYGPVPVDAFSHDGAVVATGESVHMAGDLAPNDATVLAWAQFTACERGGQQVPFITSKSYASGGRAIVWNIGTFGHDAFDIRERLNVPIPSELLQLPKEMLDLLRHTATAPLGFAITAPARVASFLFARHLVLVNYGVAAAEAEVAGLALDAASLESDSATAACSGNRFYLAPRSYAMVKRTR